MFELDEKLIEDITEALYTQAQKELADKSDEIEDIQWEEY